MTEIHLVALLNMMTDVCQNITSSLDDACATSVADLALAELTGSSGMAIEQASNLMVALSKTACSQAIGALIIKYRYFFFILNLLTIYIRLYSIYI